LANPAFIVEGQMEQRILRKLCPGSPAKRIGCNGDNVALEVMAKFIATQIRLLGNRHYPIFVIFDREQRDDTSIEIAARVLNLLSGLGLVNHDIRIFIPDRMTEDWILKDIESLEGRLKVPKIGGKYSGKGGLTKLLGDHTPYNECTTGVELFCGMNAERVASRCEIFQSLRQACQEIECAAFN
jgi:hypothetical protein